MLGIYKMVENQNSETHFPSEAEPLSSSRGWHVVLHHMVFTCHIWNMREVLVSCREKWKKCIADLHVLGLFMAKKHDLSEKKKFRVSRAVAVAVERKICATPTA
jgi:hypothetical protein